MSYTWPDSCKNIYEMKRKTVTDGDLLNKHLLVSGISGRDQYLLDSYNKTDDYLQSVKKTVSDNSATNWANSAISGFNSLDFWAGASPGTPHGYTEIEIEGEPKESTRVTISAGRFMSISGVDKTANNTKLRIDVHRDVYDSYKILSRKNGSKQLDKHSNDNVYDVSDIIIGANTTAKEYGFSMNNSEATKGVAINNSKAGYGAFAFNNCKLDVSYYGMAINNSKLEAAGYAFLKSVANNAVALLKSSAYASSVAMANSYTHGRSYAFGNSEAKNASLAFFNSTADGNGIAFNKSSYVTAGLAINDCHSVTGFSMNSSNSNRSSFVYNNACGNTGLLGMNCKNVYSGIAVNSHGGAKSVKFNYRDFSDGGASQFAIGLGDGGNYEGFMIGSAFDSESTTIGGGSTQSFSIDSQTRGGCNYGMQFGEIESDSRFGGTDMYSIILSNGAAYYGGCNSSMFIGGSDTTAGGCNRIFDMPSHASYHGSVNDVFNIGNNYIALTNSAVILTNSRGKTKPNNVIINATNVICIGNSDVSHSSTNILNAIIGTDSTVNNASGAIAMFNSSVTHDKSVALFDSFSKEKGSFRMFSNTFEATSAGFVNGVRTIKLKKNTLIDTSRRGGINNIVFLTSYQSHIDLPGA